VFLGVTKSDSRIEFLSDANGNPVQVRDSRFCAATSQAYAASTYGIGQVAPRDWLVHGTTYNKVLNITDPTQNSFAPIFTLISDNRIGALLTAARHADLAGPPQTTGGSRLAYESAWSRVFHDYNSQDPTGYAYAPSDSRINMILQGSACFEPGRASSADCQNPWPLPPKQN